jgi:hypothetical protein
MRDLKSIKVYGRDWRRAAFAMEAYENDAKMRHAGTWRAAYGNLIVAGPYASATAQRKRILALEKPRLHGSNGSPGHQCRI